MKIKEKQGFKQIYGLCSALALFLCGLLLLPLPTGAVTRAAENGFLDENYNMTEEYSALLSEECNLYSSLDTTAQKAVSKSVLNLINDYRKELLDVQSHPDADKRLLSKEIKLAYTKGCAAGRLGWIYYYNSPRFENSDSISEIDKAFSDFIAEINSATDSAVLSARSEVIAAQMNRKVYSLLIKELSESGDSLASASVIAGGLSKVELIDAPDLFALELAEILASTEQSLKLQRGRDLLSDELQKIFKIILPSADYSSDKNIALFAYKLKNANSIQDMNTALQSTLDTLLEVSDNELYTFLYRSELKESIAAATLKASSEERSAELLYLFDSFSLLSSKAQTKDEIRGILFAAGGESDRKLIEIEKQFNGEGGFIDVTSKEMLTLEVIRAKTLKECYTASLQVRGEIDIVLEPYEHADFNSRIDESFKDFLKNLYAISGYLNFEQSCEKLLKDRLENISKILHEAKAERFLLDHKKILQKSSEELSADDEIALRHALSDYGKLEAEVRDALKSQINSIAKKYNSVLSQIIRSKLIDDALYLDLCEAICKELREIPKDNIDEYYNNCDRILQKSETLAEIIVAYRSVCTDELYGSFNSEERENIILVCRESCASISSVNLNDAAIFDTELKEILEDSKLKMSRIYQGVRIRIASRNSENAEIKAIAAEANAKIKASYDKVDMIAIADKAIFKINRLLTVDAIALYCDESTYSISKMEFLSTDEKETATSKIASLKKSLSGDAQIAENVTVLNFIWESFCEKLKEICDNADQTNLLRSREEHISLLDKEVESLAEDLRGMAHLSSAKSEEYLNKAIQLQSSFSAKAVSAASSEKVKELYKETLENLNSIRISASGENLNNYKVILKEKLLEFKNISVNYSAENYNTILSIISESIAKLDTLGSIADCNALLTSTQQRIDSVKDLLDEAKEDAINKLEALATTYRSQSELYSSAAMSGIEQILSEGKRIINSFSQISEIPTLKAELDERLASLRSVKKDYLTTSPSGLSFSTSEVEYPLQYDFSTGYWGLIYAPSSLPPDAQLSLLPHTLGDLDEIKSLIRKAAKEGTISYKGGSLDASIKELIKDGEAAFGFDINLSGDVQLDFPITMQMLLPSELKQEKVLGIAFLTEDGKVEFYGIEQRGMLISFPLERFSTYYVIVEGSLSLLPLITVLTFTIIIEFLVLGILLFVRFKRRRKENDSMLPMLSSYFFSPLGAIGATKIRPSGAVSASILLSVAALALGCGIALLIRAELRDSSQKKKNINVKAQAKQTEAKKQERLSASAEKPLLRAKVYSLKSAESLEEKVQRLLEENSGEDIHGTISLKQKVEADLSDYTMDFEEEEDEEDNGFRKERRHKCEVNLDVIESCFEAGDLVTLDALKHKRIAPKKADYVKILARGALSKPLVIEAHDFSRAAEEMLKAVGGEAIRIKR